ncbi:MAG TPA: Spy/CpxP family protein refolding chaperone, partial [Smithellaceae bacterium]|nr:Spy/CpxP family protein refolding chaperone [Smithellaceae bacterium]
AIMVGLLLASQAFAWGPGRGYGPGRGGCFYSGAGLENLNLTADQKTKIDDLQVANEKATRPLRDKLYDKSVELRKLWLTAEPNKGKILAAQKELKALRDEMQTKATELRLDIRKVLTPEQNAKLADTGWGKGPGFGPRGGMRGHHGSGPGYGPGPGLGMGVCP